MTKPGEAEVAIDSLGNFITAAPVGGATEATLALIKAKTDNLDVALSTRAITGITDAQLRASAVPVSLAVAPALVASSAVIGHVIVDTAPTTAITAASLPLPTGAATSALQTTLNAQVPTTLGQKAMAASMAVVIASDQSAVGVTPPTLTKGTQGATGVSTQDLKDAGRVNIAWTVVDQALTAATETLMTVTESRDGAAVTTFTSTIITSGKRLRITSVTAYAEAGGSVPVAARVSVRLRVNTAGAATNASPLQIFLKMPLLGATVKTVVSQFADFPDGIEFLGDGTKQLCWTVLCPEWATTTELPVVSLNVFGFYY